MKVRLGDVCGKESSNIAQKDLEARNGKYPVYGAAGLIKTVDFYQQDKEYIAIVKDGAGVGRTMILPAQSSVIGTMQYIIPKDNISIKFLYYVISWMKLEKYCLGAAIPHIYFKDYKNEEFDLPTKEEQLHIVEKLDKVDTLIEKQKRQLEKLDLLVKSEFIEMFVKKEFALVCFGDLCEFLRNGATIKQIKGAGGYPITRIETLSNDVFNVNRLGYADVTNIEKYNAYLLRKGDILISHLNSVSYLGRAVQYRGELETPVIHGMNLLCARLNDRVLPDYIESFFRTKKAKDYIATITKKAVNQASITTADLKKMKIPVPPIELQERFASFVKQADQEKFTIKQSLEKLETLKKAFMQKYFG